MQFDYNETLEGILIFQCRFKSQPLDKDISSFRWGEMKNTPITNDMNYECIFAEN